jgi:hypothetical protein
MTTQRKPPDVTRPDASARAATESFYDAMIAVNDESLAAFLRTLRRSRKGNLWMKLTNGETVSVFARGQGYGWSIAGPGGAMQWSPQTYDSEALAVGGLLCELERRGGADGVDLTGLPPDADLDGLPRP